MTRTDQRDIPDHMTSAQYKAGRKEEGGGVTLGPPRQPLRLTRTDQRDIPDHMTSAQYKAGRKEEGGGGHPWSSEATTTRIGALLPEKARHRLFMGSNVKSCNIFSRVCPNRF
ncbi:unnamed protein product, partial [Bubo scandiacus]